MIPVSNVLFIRLKSIGDVVLTLSAVNLVRDNYPAARITFLTSKENLPILSGFTAVDERASIDRAALRRLQPRSVYANTIGLVRRLRREKFDLVVDLQGYGETAWLTRLTGAPQRWGSVYQSARRWAYTRGLDRDDHVHPAQWHVSLLTQCGLKALPLRNEFALAEEDGAAARTFLAGMGWNPAKPTLYLQPFTSAAHKNWPLEKYLALAGHWRERGIQVLFGGGPADRPALEPARSAGFWVSAGVPGMTSAGLMAQSSLIVGGDTGFIHLAVALGKRVLMLIKPHGTGTPLPFGHPEWVVTPQANSSVADIEVEAVVRATQSAWSHPGT